MTKLICSSCGKATYRSYLGKKFTCRFCKYEQPVNVDSPIIEETEQTEESLKEEGNEMSGILDNIEESQDVKFKVEPVTAEINPAEVSQMPENLPQINRVNKVVQTRQSFIPTKKEPLPWAPDTFRKAFEMVDATMKAKSNSEVWDVSKEEERKLAEMWADVANEYAPKASSKEVKLVMAVVGTGAVYTPRIISLVQAHKNKKKKDIKIIEDKQTENKEEEQPEVQVIVPPSQDEQFKNEWINRKPGDY